MAESIDDDEFLQKQGRTIEIGNYELLFEGPSAKAELLPNGFVFYTQKIFGELIDTEKGINLPIHQFMEETDKAFRSIREKFAKSNMSPRIIVDYKNAIRGEIPFRALQLKVGDLFNGMRNAKGEKCTIYTIVGNGLDALFYSRAISVGEFYLKRKGFIKAMKSVASIEQAFNYES